MDLLVFNNCLFETLDTARQIAKFRPGMPIVVLTKASGVARQCNGVLKGVQTMVVSNNEETNIYIGKVVEALKKKGILVAGDAMVIVHGSISQIGATNIMKIEFA